MIILYLTKSNRNSIYSLLGILEVYNYNLGEDVFILDSEIIPQEINKFEKHIFFFSFTTTDTNANYKILNKLKKTFKNSIFICGGSHPSGNPEDCLLNSFDFAVKGEGENIIKDILNLKFNNKKILHSKTFVDINKFHPFPLKDPHYSLYMEITRGCPYNCYFCQTTKIFGAKLRHRTIDNILKYTEILLKNNITDIRFVSPNAFSYGSEKGTDINYAQLSGLLKSLKKLIKNKGRIFFGSFPSEARPEFVNDETISLLKKYCNNKNIMIGAQSGSENILQKIHRKHSVEDIINAAQISKKYDLQPNIDIITGFPFENKNDISSTLILCEYLIKIGCKIHIHKFTPLPGTQFKDLKPSELFPEIKNFINKWMGKGIVWGKF